MKALNLLLDKAVWAKALTANALVLSCTLAPSAAQAATDFPSKPVKIVVGFSAGGTTDVLARLLANEMPKTLNQPVIVENRSGASGTIAADFVARAPADGYTLMLTTTSVQGITPALYKNLPYDPYKAFAPISQVSQSVMVLLANDKLPVKSVSDLVKLAKEKPGELTYASAGTGSTAHIVAEYFFKKKGVKLLHVPYRGGSAGVVGVMGGEVDVIFDNIASTRTLIDGGRIKALAVTSKDRSSSLPNVPTFVESGTPDFTIYSWGGIVASAGTPPEIIKKLNEAVNKAVQSQTVREALLSGDTEPKSGTPEEFARFIAEEQKKWAEAVTLTGITVE